MLYARPPHNFCGVFEHDFSKARAAVLPVPFDATSSWKAGARDGPAAMIEASRHMEWFDEELKAEIAQEVGVFTLEELEPSMEGVGATLERVEKAVGEILEAGKFPIVFGGEHSVTCGALKAIAEKEEEFSLLQLDAHADLREEFEGSRLNHACAMRRAREIVPGEVVQVGVRSLSREESDAIGENDWKVHFWHEEKLPAEKALKELGGKVYVSIDVDVLNPAEMPATGTPEPGGPGYEEVVAFLRKVTAKKKIIGFDVMELAPIPGFHAADFLAARLAYKMLGYSLLKR